MDKKENIVVGSDHGGFPLKEAVKERLQRMGCAVVDVGCFSLDSVDYPDYAEKVVNLIVGGDCRRGILICGTGIGMSIAANRNPGIRAANCHNLYTAEMSREHNDANVLCLGARVLDKELAMDIVDTWMKTEFAGGRHQVRIDKFR